MKSSPIATSGVILAALLSLLGMSVSGVLLQHHVVLEVGGDPLLRNVCEATANASCDEVLASEYSSMVGLPTAMWGMFFFAALASWFILVGRPTGSRRLLHLLPLFATAAGTIACGWFAYVMFAKLSFWCPLCVTLHVTTAVLLIVTALLWPRRGSEAVSAAVENVGPSAHPSGRLFVAVVLLAGAVCAAAYSEYDRRLQATYAKEYFDRWQDYEKDVKLGYDNMLAQDRFDIEILPTDPIRGSADAPHTVVVFSDFQCSYCKSLSELLDQRMAEHPGEFRVVFKHFPMNQQCNSRVVKSLHKWSCSSAVAAEAVLLLKGEEAFWQMHDELFASQKEYSEDFAFATAEKLGIIRDDYKKRILTRSAWERIKANIEQAHELKVSATPAMFFDGRRMAKWGDRHLWRYLLGKDDKLATPTTSSPASQPATQPQ